MFWGSVLTAMFFICSVTHIKKRRQNSEICFEVLDYLYPNTRVEPTPLT